MEANRTSKVITSAPIENWNTARSSIPSAHFLFQLRLQPRHDSPPLHERWPLEHRTVHLNVILGHAGDREALLEPLPNCPAIEREHLGQRSDCLGHRADDRAGHAWIDDLRDRAAAEGEHRRPAGHGLDHRQSERLGPVDREYERSRIAQELALGTLINLPNKFHTRSIE